MCLARRASALWLRYATQQNLIPSFSWIAPPHPPPCAPKPSTLAQSKESKGLNFAIWQPCHLREHGLEGGVEQAGVEADPGVHEHSPSGRLPAREGRLHEGQQVRRGQGRPNLKDEEDEFDCLAKGGENI